MREHIQHHLYLITMFSLKRDEGKLIDSCIQEVPEKYFKVKLKDFVVSSKVHFGKSKEFRTERGNYLNQAKTKAFSSVLFHSIITFNPVKIRH